MNKIIEAAEVEKEMMDANAATDENTRVSIVEGNKGVVVATLEAETAAPMGFEDEDEGDMIIPRIKVINMLSPEVKDKVADEGDIIDSLTKEILNAKVFVPVFKFSSNILWKPRAEGGGITCTAKDGKMGIPSETTQAPLQCVVCRKNEFDNTKQGPASFPTCTKYINFFGFMSDSKMPIILSFAKTNYNEGKKLYSLAKVTMQNMWNHGYELHSKRIAKNGNEWYNIEVRACGATDESDRAIGTSLFKMYRKTELNMDADTTEQAAPVDTKSSEF